MIPFAYSQLGIEEHRARNIHFSSSAVSRSAAVRFFETIDALRGSAQHFDECTVTFGHGNDVRTLLQPSAIHTILSYVATRSGGGNDALMKRCVSMENRWNRLLPFHLYPLIPFAQILPSPKRTDHQECEPLYSYFLNSDRSEMLPVSMFYDNILCSPCAVTRSTLHPRSFAVPQISRTIKTFIAAFPRRRMRENETDARTRGKAISVQSIFRRVLRDHLDSPVYILALRLCLRLFCRAIAISFALVSL